MLGFVDMDLVYLEKCVIVKIERLFLIKITVLLLDTG